MYRLDRIFFNVWWSYVFLNTNANHFCDIIFRHRAVFPSCNKNSVGNQKSGRVRINWTTIWSIGYRSLQLGTLYIVSFFWLFRPDKVNLCCHLWFCQSHFYLIYLWIHKHILNNQKPKNINISIHSSVAINHWNCEDKSNFIFGKNFYTKSQSNLQIEK